MVKRNNNNKDAVKIKAPAKSIMTLNGITKYAEQRNSIRRMPDCACEGGCPRCRALIDQKEAGRTVGFAGGTPEILLPKYEGKAKGPAAQAKTSAKQPKSGKANAGKTPPAAGGDSQAGQSKTAPGKEQFNFQFSWENEINPFFEKIPTESLSGSGHYQPHGKPGCWIGRDFCSMPPVVTSIVAEKGKPAQVQVKCFANAVIQLPAEGAYPVYGNKDEAKNNVVDNKALGLRTPETPQGKGHWENVADKLEFYKEENGGRLDEIKWWIKGSTEYHESVHHREYLKWFKQNEALFSQKITDWYSQALEPDREKSGDATLKASLESGMKYILDNDREMCGPENDEAAAYNETREKYWLKEAFNIREHFNPKK